jgi:hypothetical protein
MKKIISVILTLTMLLSIASVSASAAEFESNYKDSETFVDPLGDEYTLSGEKAGNSYIATLTASDGTMISQSVLNFTTGEIESTALADVLDSVDVGIIMSNVSSNDSGRYITFTENVSDYIVSVDENENVTRAGGYDSRYDYPYRTYKTGMKTDFIYQGKILTGDCDYRCTGDYDETDRESYAFIRGMLLTSVETALAWVLGGAKAGVPGLVLSLIENFGIEYGNGKLLENFNPTVSIRSFDFKFRTKMKPATTNVVMCITDRQIDYVYAKVNNQDSLIGVDMISYATEESAIAGMCSESLGYAAYAFEAKYITQNYPDLRLPVSGPSYTWDV